ncbi:MAG: sensor histidine kinase [Chloroflexota bacterium]|nr:sensor histidine kinase [Chloroflexota bacterium]
MLSPWRWLVPGMRRFSMDAQTEAAPQPVVARLPIDALAIVEAERRRIARDLHDVVGQALTAVQLSAASTSRIVAHPGIAAELGDMMTTIQLALQEIRSYALSLRPPVLDDLGLVMALRVHLDREARQGGLKVSLVGDGVPDGLPASLETAAFRIAQEAITNTIAHARASSLHVQLKLHRGSLLLRVLDDGTGFDPETADRSGAHLGLLGMGERATLAGGMLRLRSGRHGTLVRAQLPLMQHPTQGLDA